MSRALAQCCPGEPSLRMEMLCIFCPARQPLVTHDGRAPALWLPGMKNCTLSCWLPGATGCHAERHNWTAIWLQTQVTFIGMKNIEVNYFSIVYICFFFYRERVQKSIMNCYLYKFLLLRKDYQKKKKKGLQKTRQNIHRTITTANSNRIKL